MIKYLSGLVNQLKCISLSLDKRTILIDKPWALLDNEGKLQKLIFKKNQELILSKNGKVKLGKWEYYPEARSILIDRKDDILLCNEGYIDDNVLILKLDGTEDEFFVLANENELPDLNVVKYLTELKNKELNIITKEIFDERIMEIQCNYPNDTKLIGNKVYIDSNEVPDGTYKFKNESRAVEIRKSRVSSIHTKIKYRTKRGLNIEIEQRNEFAYDRGDLVWINNKPAPDGKYKLNFWESIKVKNGKII